MCTRTEPGAAERYPGQELPAVRRLAYRVDAGGFTPLADWPAECGRCEAR